MSRKVAFERDGYLQVPGALSAAQVAEGRRFLASIFDRPSAFEGDYDAPTGNVRFDACARYDALRWILLHPPLVEALRELLGTGFAYLPETVAHDSIRGHWHKDTSAQLKAGHRFHFAPDYAMVQCAIYFQDNTVEYGGGVDVIPGSHRAADSYSSPLQRVANRLRKKGLWFEKSGGTSVMSKAGDLVLFDFRIDHRGTPAARTPIPPEARKFALFIAASADNAHARAYCDYIGGRADYRFLKEHRYPEAFLDEAKSRGVSLLKPSAVTAVGGAAEKKY